MPLATQRRPDICSHLSIQTHSQLALASFICLAFNKFALNIESLCCANCEQKQMSKVLSVFIVVRLICLRKKYCSKSLFKEASTV
jgi:hypothetical protein